MPSRTLRRRLIAPSAVALALLVGGCSASPHAAVKASNTIPADAGGTIHYAHLQEPNCIYGGWVQEAFTARQVLDSLVSQTEAGEIVPWIATGWSVSPDQLVWTLTLRDGVSFTDGTPLDAAAVAANFDHWLNGGNGTAAAHLGGFYDHAVATDRLTVAIHLKKPFAPFLSAISQPYFGLQSPTALANRSKDENCQQPIGSGAFVVSEWKRGAYIEFTRNEAYDWGPANARHQGPALVERIRWTFVPDNTALYGSLLSAESDVIGEVPAVNLAKARERFEVQQYITPGRPVVLSLNTVRGPFADVRVRQALAYATDRRANIESAFLGTVPFEGNAYVSQSTPGYDRAAAAAYPFDLERANALLDDAGWTERADDGTRIRDGQPLEAKIVFGANSILTPDGATVVQNLQEQARAAGFRIVLRPLTQSELFSGSHSKPSAYEGYVGYWTSPHAGILNINYRPHLPDTPNGANNAFFNNHELYDRIQQALQAPTESESFELFGQAQALLVEQSPAIGLYTQTSTLAIDPRLRDVWTEGSQGAPVFADAYFTAERP